MSDAVSEWLDAAEADAHRKVILGQPVARELDRLLANDWANLARALAALRAVLAQHHLHDCSPEHGSWCSPCWSEGLCEGCSEDWPCPTVEGVAEALGVQR